jgi:hypothetical protein
MGNLRVEHKENSRLNGEWAGHVRGFMKRFTSKRRRNDGKKDIQKRMSE